MPSYPIVPDRVLERQKRFSTLIVSDPNRKEARRARNEIGNPKRSWTLFHDHISYADMMTLRAFFIARRGRWDSFMFTDPADGQTHNVRFDADVLSIEHPLYNRFSVQVPIVEVL